MSLPIICFDIDGTLVNKDGIIHPFDIEILKNEKCAYFIPTTGRPLHSVKKVFLKNNLFANDLIPFPLILQNGAVIYNPNENLGRIFPINEKDLKIIVSLSEIKKDVAVLLFSIDNVYIKNINNYARNFIKRFDLNTQSFDNENSSDEITKIMFISKKEKVLKQIVEKISCLNLEYSFSLSTVLEVNQRGINKGKSLAIILNELNLNKEKIIAAGDGENDLPLFNLATFSICPERSLVTVKKRANFIIDINKEGLLKPIFKIIDLK